MSRWRCKACKGVFEDPAPDGTRYFHVCPPLVDPETGESTLRKGHRDERPQEVAVQRDDRGYTISARDGTVLVRNAPTVSIPIVAEGAGREKIS